MRTRKHVSRKEIRKMRIGQTRIFTFDDKKKITSAIQNIRQMQKEEGSEFDMKADYDSSSVSFTRIK